MVESELTAWSKIASLPGGSRVAVGFFLSFNIKIFPSFDGRQFNKALVQNSRGRLRDFQVFYFDSSCAFEIKQSKKKS